MRNFQCKMFGGFAVLAAAALAALAWVPPITADEAAAPVTLTDVQYGVKRTVITLGSHRGFILEPPTPPPDGSRPWVWYAPTFIGVLPDKSNGWLLTRLLQRGFAVCGVDVGESFGNPEGRKVFSQFHDYFTKTYKLDTKASLLPQSRGGLMLYNWGAENPEKVLCIGGIYPVCDMRSWPGLERAAPAYGITPQELADQLNRHNPIDRLAPLAKAGVPILHVHGDADKVVPLEQNSQTLRDRYAALGGKMELGVIPGKGHEVVPEFFESEPLLRFLSNGGR